MLKSARYLAAATVLSLSSVQVLAADFTMKIALTHAQPAEGVEHYEYTPLEEFAKEVETASDGRIEVNIYWGGALGKAENVLNMVRGGHVEATTPSDGHIAPYFSDVEMLGLPYLFLDRSIAYEVLDGPFGKAFADQMAEVVNMRPLVWLENGGYRHFSSKKPIAKAEDMQGLKMRTMSNPVHMEIVKILGASPTPLPYADLYTGLQTGVVDGQENSLPVFRQSRLEEVQTNIIMDGHVYSLTSFVVNENWYKKLPEDLRAVVDSAAKNMLARNREISQNQESEDRKYLEDKGVTVVDLSLEEKARFQELTREKALSYLRERVDGDLLDMLLAEVAKAEK